MSTLFWKKMKLKEQNSAWNDGSMEPYFAEIFLFGYQ
jgi:hypothetical protein